MLKIALETTMSILYLPCYIWFHLRLLLTLLFKKLLEEIIDDSNLQTKYAKYIVDDQQETERKQNNIEQGLSYNAQY